MSDKTNIEWCDSTWPVLAGCKPVSPGCANCYAERLTATRLKNVPKYKGLAVIGQNGHPHFTGESRLWREHLDWPLKWKAPRKIFVADMSDLFYEGVSNEEIAIVFGVMAACPDHTFQVLTKRAERMREWFKWVARDGDANYAVAQALADSGIIDTSRFEDRLRGTIDFDESRWPLSNVWLGVSVEDQKRADERIPHLLETPAAVRFLSCEPLLGPLNLLEWIGEKIDVVAGCSPHPEGGFVPIEKPVGHQLHWVIVGGESGPRARGLDLARARSIVQQCRDAGTKCFVKQLGSYPYERAESLDSRGYNPADLTEAMRRPRPPQMEDWTRVITPNEAFYTRGLRFKDRKGGDMAEWPEDLRAREMPDAPPRSATDVCEHGDHAALDGKRFCSKACERCEHESKSENGCDGICGGRGGP